MDEPTEDVLSGSRLRSNSGLSFVKGSALVREFGEEQRRGIAGGWCDALRLVTEQVEIDARTGNVDANGLSAIAATLQDCHQEILDLRRQKVLDTIPPSRGKDESK